MLIYVFFRGWLDIFANDFQLFNEVQKHWQIIVLKGQYNLAQGNDEGVSPWVGEWVSKSSA